MAGDTSMWHVLARKMATTAVGIRELKLHAPKLIQRAAFERLLPELERRYRGRYVAVHAGRVVGADPDPDALFERIWRKLRGRTFFIGRVGDLPPIVDMPGFEVE